MKTKHARLLALRKKIDAADRAILKNLSVRAKVAAQIGEYKIKHKLPLLQKGRWELVLENCVRVGAKAGLSRSFIKNIWNEIHKESIRVQRGKKR